MEKKKSTGLLLSILGVISLVLITAGVTYAFFSYTKEGTKTNTIQTGKITFRYDENSTNGFTLDNALPMSDANGQTQTTRQNDPIAFNFSITSNTPATATIPYVITVRDVTDPAKTKLPTNQVKIYLMDNDSAGGSNKTVDNNVVKVFSELPTTATSTTYDWYNTAAAINARGGDAANNVPSNDKIIYEGVVPVSQSANYTKTFTLGMWLKLADSGMADYSAYEFVLAGEADDAAGTSVSTLATAGKLLTSAEYYRRVNLASGNDKINASDYRRIAYVNYADGKIIEKADTTLATPETQVTPSSMTNWSQSEQYYPLNQQEFSVRVNVYAEGVTTY